MKFGIGSFRGEVLRFAFDGNNFYSIKRNEKSILDLIQSDFSIQRENMMEGPDFFLPPFEDIKQIRDFYAFEDHVVNSRKSRGLQMLKEWYEVPVYYYTSNSSLYGSGMEVPYPQFTRKLDLEVEVGFIIGKDGRNIKEEEGLDYICGLTLMNDWSARDLWIPESKLNLGPSKSKDFATSIGPYITPLKEVMHLYDGKSFNIRVRSQINGIPFSDSNLRDIYWSVGKLVSYASMESNLRKGDILMTGTLPGGSKFERQVGDGEWIKKGDKIEIISEELGKLENVVV
ncbi:fumarylacetoacetate hydrolase family protein [Cuniculiplasma sp. SKW3]|uniref:fumarylacetoacetate hydrolase family protein n=1 Tax=unclassified Cuniculiplasma TaxID=2619706 RepID=UPI003FD606E8